MEKYLALKASAGSGKTFALTVRYISLLLLGANPNEILTLTFTNKAASQMGERILDTLQKLGSDESYLEEISKVSKLNKSEIIDRKAKLIDSFTNSSLSIFTIDKFVNKILKEFSGYIGVSDDFEILSDDEELLGLHFLNSLDEKLYKDLIDFSIYEKKKFNSIFSLFKFLIEKNENINSIELDETLIDSLKSEILKEAFKVKDHFLSCELASASAKKAVSFENFEELFSTTWIEKESLYDYSYFKKCADENINLIFLRLKEIFKQYYKIRSAYSLSKISNLYLAFKEFKRTFNKRKNYYEFSDISNMVYELLSSKIDKDFLYFRLDSKYNHILIDEFQDTSILQYKILYPLIEEIISSTNDKFKTFFYVGDPKQSIYRFRGGNKKLFDYVLEQNNQIVLDSLNTNYRSHKVLVDFVNSNFLSLTNYSYQEQNCIKAGGYIEVFEDEELLNEDKFVNIKNKINELLKEGINENDIAVLCYTNSDVLELYYYLKESIKEIKIRTDMSSKLINSQNVKAIINLIKYIYFKEEIYKENYNALIGKSINSNIDTDFYFEEKSVYEIVHTLAYKYDLMDENIIQLLGNLNSYKNIVEFVYNIDKLETSIENSENSGLQILTIFKSKGLEFHTVIVLDRIKRKSYDRSSLLFSYKNIELENIYYKIKGYESFDEDYKKALEDEKSLVEDDEKNVLYVALTRAKSNMIIFKKTKSSAFDILNMKDIKIGELVRSKIIDKKDDIVKVEYNPLFLGKQEQKIKSDISFNDEYLRAKYIGLATHYILEMMNDFTLDELEYTLKLAKSRYLSFLAYEEFDNIKILVLNLITNDIFINLIKDKDRFSEQYIMYKEELKIIDLLLYKDGIYTIIDYKTTSEILSSHKNQVSYYKKAVEDIFNTKNVEAYLIYLKENKVEILKV
ncbi:RecB-like helicase [Aliarcobacter thereius]|uniref:DNA 3'-5' helicase n=1 Tax=Aliarcobacter thereius LMG 24486 TaxID=1032240 RepID=A0A1C7WQS5_9BACT|nr:RecB-like helicase [Aliarcobacter thereius]OCL92162.1 putative ATP-dependent DNA helicase YjcD [Aliarcobacter thereius]OCL94742.1 putative ATP-dependent DNA helicase YjcD [Aliarcobacter thereius LMG 24486]QBF15382.1 AddAB recombination complex, helicase AddA [Aliarcobacter thereius LMG 24486]TLS93199.1 RecB-like helicase [Aliarcobacter thereius]